MDDKFFFIVAQKAMIRKDGKYLILKRHPDDVIFPDHWDFPGGKLERGENFKEGLAREVLEESGLEVKVKDPVFIFNEFNSQGNQVFFVVQSCELIKGNVKLSEEHTEYKWAAREEILQLPMENYLKAYLEKNKSNDK